MNARKTKQPVVGSGRVFTEDDYAYIGRMMADAYEHRLKLRGATAADLENATHERGNAFAAARGYANADKSGASAEATGVVGGGLVDERAHLMDYVLQLHIITGPNGMCMCGEDGITCSERLRQISHEIGDALLGAHMAVEAGAVKMTRATEPRRSHTKQI